ncbi:hypothetical protein HKD37_17G047292 [Glycine soja]
MVKTRSLGQALDRIIERALGRKVKGDVDEPTTFARKQRKIAHVAGNVEHVDHSYDEIHEQPEEAATDDVVTDVEGFLGGSHDISILMDYIYHVAVKLSSHERKVEKFDRFVPEIEGLLTIIGLSPLIAYSFDTDDRRLISVFAERKCDYNPRRCDIVATSADYKGLPKLRGFSCDEIVLLLVELLEVSSEEVRTETVQCHGTYVRLSCLRDIYRSKCDATQWTVAARTYLLHLIGCTLFAHKSVTHVHVPSSHTLHQSIILTFISLSNYTNYNFQMNIQTISI